MSKQKEKIVRVSVKDLKKMKGKTDWKKVDSITDEELEETVKNDIDDIYLTDKDLEKGEWIAKGEWAKKFNEPQKKEQITLRLDEDVLKYFRKSGRGYQTRINNALRAFVKAHENHHP